MTEILNTGDEKKSYKKEIFESNYGFNLFPNERCFKVFKKLKRKYQNNPYCDAYDDLHKDKKVINGIIKETKIKDGKLLEENSKLVIKITDQNSGESKLIYDEIEEKHAQEHGGIERCSIMKDGLIRDYSNPKLYPSKELTKKDWPWENPIYPYVLNFI